MFIWKKADNWDERLRFFFHSHLVAILKTSVAQVAMENKDKITVGVVMWIQYKVQQIITN